MRVISMWSGAAMAVVVLAGLTLSGCDSGSTPAENGQPAGQVDDYGGWWCSGHGVPEEVCTRCDTSLAAEYQQKGDWCEEHKRPESQCFICNPDAEAKFAADYEAKFGKKPPKSTE